MKASLRNLLLYGSLDENTYNKYKLDILEQDMYNLTLYLIVTALGFFILGLANLTTGTLESVNTRVYFMTTMITVAILVIQQMLLGKEREFPIFKSVLIYAYISVVYAQAIFLTVQHKDLPAVTFLGTLLVMPILFARRPIVTIFVQIVFTVVFCYFVAIYKTPGIISKDMWNGITFCVFSIVALLVVVPVRIRELAQTQTIRRLSEYDILTDTKNRNSYEGACEACNDNPESRVVVYVDVNGLHELNDTQGHAAGDAMLCAVADIIKDAFGEEYTYRIGGDEFVVLAPDIPLRSIEDATAQINRRVIAAGYAVSIGYARSLACDEPLSAVIQRAEAEMYAAKKRYYQATGKNRRRG